MKADKEHALNAERYRRLLEAYQIELDYGRTMISYKGKLEDGREADFVRVGRVSLLYRTADGEEVGILGCPAEEMGRCQRIQQGN